MGLAGIKDLQCEVIEDRLIDRLAQVICPGHTGLGCLPDVIYDA